MKEKFLLFLGASTLLIILSVFLTTPKSTKQALLVSPSSPSRFFGQFLEKLEKDKPITLIAVGDVMLGRSVNAKSIAVVRRSEFIEKVKHIMDNPRTYTIDMGEYSWKRKAKEFEELLEELIQKARK